MNADEAKRLVALAVARGIEGMGLQEFIPNVPELAELFSESDITWCPSNDDDRTRVRKAFRAAVEELTKRGTP